MKHQLSLRTDPRTVKYNCREVSSETASQFEDTSSKSVGKFFELRPQSGSEHELTDPLTSLRCLAPVLRCMFCVETKRVLLSVLERRSGVVFLSAPAAREVLQGNAGRFSPCFSHVGSLTCFVTRATLSVYLKPHPPSQCSCCSFVTEWSGIHPLIAEVVVHGR